MKIIKAAVIILITLAVLSFIRDGRQFHIARVLPFCDGRISEYHLAGLVMCIIAIWGLKRIGSKNED
jgi:hypothetical protein